MNQLILQIQQLKTELVERYKEIKSLKEELNDLELNPRNETIKRLQDRVENLEKEKENLEKELVSITNEVSTLKSNLKDLSTSKEKQDEENQKTLDRLREDLDKTKDENNELRKEIEKLKELLQSAGVKWNEMAVINLGELCRQIQAYMFKIILPKHYTPIGMYKVKYFLTDIELLSIDEKEKEEAERKWEELKETLKWKDGYERAMRTLQEDRNRQAHPEITEESLKEDLERLEKQNVLKGYISAELVKDLIEMWKQLKDQLKHLKTA